jgi:hypothetical protein
MLLNQKFNFKGKKNSRRLFVKNFLIAITVINSLESLKVNKDELAKNITSKEPQLEAKALILGTSGSSDDPHRCDDKPCRKPE